jgi:hypothetical protein
MTRALVAMTCVMTAVIAITLWLHTIVTPADVMIGYAQDAVEHARKHHAIELDYSEESIETLEGLIAKMSAQDLPAEKQDLYAKMWGGYFGEIIRRQHGGTWSQRQTGGEYLLTAKGTQIAPVRKVHEGLAKGGALGSFYGELLTDWSH